MHLHDNEFFEEYKWLDKLCSEMYNCNNGVSEYITQMENKSVLGQTRVFLWDYDYKMLKHVRWIRNRIAHDSDEFQVSEQSDLEFVKAFHKRILAGQDSLTLLRKAIETENAHKKQKNRQEVKQQITQVPTNIYSIPSENKPPKKKSHGWVGFLIAIVALTIILIIIASR